MIKNKLCCLIILMIGGFSFGQQTKKTELVTFRESGFSDVVTEIIQSAYRGEGMGSFNTWPKERLGITHSWYVKKLREDVFLVSVWRTVNLIQSPEEKSVYVSIVDNEVVLYITPMGKPPKMMDNMISRTGFVIDLEKYMREEYVLDFASIPYWIVKRGDNGGYSIVRRVTY